MSAQTHGGPAFPRFVPEGHYNGSVDAEGMALRDYFAAKALQGFIACLPEGLEPATVRTGMARDCYEIADAMLAARETRATSAAVTELIAAGDFLAMNGTPGMRRRWESAKAAATGEQSDEARYVEGLQR